MLGHPHRSRPSSHRRGGFTMVELLVIISILAVLAALTAAATIRFITVQQTNNTQNALNKTQAVLDNAIKASVAKWKSEAIDGNTQTYILQNLSGESDANAMERMRVIYVKLKLRQYYPETFNEALNPAPLPPLQSYVKYLNGYGVNGSGPYQYESGACLAMALQVGISGGGFNIDDIGKGGSLATVPVDPNPALNPPNGPPSLPMLVDAWGTPICFSRFPSGCPSVNPNGARVGANDPLDPRGLLNSNIAWPPPYDQNYSKLVLQDLAPASVPTKTYYLWPVLGSAGPDREFGLTMYNFMPATAQADDNLYSTPAGASK